MELRIAEYERKFAETKLAIYKTLATGVRKTLNSLTDAEDLELLDRNLEEGSMKK